MTRLRLLVGAGLVGCLLAVSACGDTQGEGSARELEVWAHDGTDAERAVLEAQVDAFNAAHPGTTVSMRFVAEGDYNDELQAAIAGGRLPDVAEVDGPLLAGYAYQDVLVPLERLVAPEVLAQQLPSLQAQGTQSGHTYAVGTFDSGLGLYADRKALLAAGIDAWPTTADEAWTAAEFTAVLEALARRDADRRVLDVKLNYGVGEWLTYGFSPLVASAGGTLIDPDSLSPRGHLDGTAVRRALETLRAWARFVDPNAEDDAFVSRQAALSWVGHWMYGDYAKALGEDLLVLPLPDLGNGAKTGQGSWAWTVTATSASAQKTAAAFLEFLLSDAEVLRMTQANGAVPGTRSALESSPLYADDGPLRLFADQLLRSCQDDPPTPRCVAVPRPATPGYAVLSNHFARAVATALAGKDPRADLEAATTSVQQDLVANDHFR